MKQEAFEIKVDGIERKEYIAACHEYVKKYLILLVILTLIFCFVVQLLSSEWSIRSVLGPLVVLLLVVIGYEVVIRATYKGQLENTDPAVYRFSDMQWSVTKGDYSETHRWEDTPKLSAHSGCIFLYADETRSSLLPERLMSSEQISILKQWFQESRAK